MKITFKTLAAGLVLCGMATLGMNTLTPDTYLSSQTFGSTLIPGRN